MFKIFIDYDKALDIVGGPEDEVWSQLFIKQQKIGINHDICNPDNQDDDPLFLFSQNTGGLDFEDESEYFNEIESDNKKVLKYPCGAFYLDIDPKIAQDIQNNYGVICQNCHDMTLGCLNQEDIDISKASPEGKTWERFSFDSIQVPTNTLIIQDRYFCASEAGETIDDTYENFERIIRTLLPQTYGDVFHLMVVIDSTTINANDNVSFDGIASCLNKIKKKIAKDRNYSILFEFISIPGSSYRYDETHNRKIVSNYYTIESPHKLKAFRGNKNLAPQTISSKFLYSKGLGNSLSDPPAESHDNWIKAFKDIIQFAPKSSNDYLYSCNGSHTEKIEDIKNRILSDQCN